MRVLRLRRNRKQALKTVVRYEKQGEVNWSLVRLAAGYAKIDLSCPSEAYLKGALWSATNYEQLFDTLEEQNCHTMYKHLLDML